MTNPSDVPNPVAILADEFVRRTRLGERPSLAEYCERFPHHADEIRRLFPTVMFLEQLKPSAGELQSAGQHLPQVPAAAPQHMGDFLILREIGRGGMGVVYEAEQLSLGRRVALKILADASSHDPKRAARFQREARSAARLHHTNIVPVFGVGTHQEIHFLVMQLIPGQGLDHVLVELRRLRNLPVDDADGAAPNVSLLAESMAQALQTGAFRPRSELSTEVGAGSPARPPPATPTAPLAPAASSESSVISPEWTTSTGGQSSRTNFGAAYFRSVTRMGIDVARALEHAHSQGVLHRDIKPSNLLLDVHGAVWVADFGLAKAEDSGSLTLTGEFVGTLRYMAPERFQGQCDERSDVYGLGLTLYELLTLTPAFDATDRARLISQVMHARTRPIRRIDGLIPADLEIIVAKSTAPSPDERYQSAGEMADDLQRYLDDLPIAARPAGALERFWRWGRRNPTIAGATVACVLLLVAWGTTSSALAVRLDSARDAAVSEGRLAERRRKEADQNRRTAVQRGAEAQANAEESRNHLVRLHVSQGSRLLEERDPLGALPHFAAALRLDEGHATRARLHRMRLSAAVGSAPRLVAVAPAPGDSEADQISPDGKLIASGPVAAFRIDSVLGPFPDSGDDRSPGGTTIEIREIPSMAPASRLEHGVRIVDHVFSPDSRTIATGCCDGSIQIWDAQTGKLQTNVAGVHAGLRALAFADDGACLISAGADQTVRVWDSATGEPLSRTVLPNSKTTIAVHPRGRRMAVNTSSRVELRDLATGEQVGDPIPAATIPVAVLVRDGTELLLAGGSPFARRYDAASGRLLFSSPDSGSRPGSLLRGGADGRWVVEDMGRTLAVWSTDSGTIINPRLGWPRTPLALAFSTAGDRLGVIGTDNTFSLWDPQTGEMLFPQLRHAPAFASAQIVPGDRYLLTRGRDRSLRMWDLASVEVSAPPVPETIVGWKWRTHSADGRFSLGYGNHRHTVRRTDTGAVAVSMGDRETTRGSEFTGDGRLVLACSREGAVRLWDPGQGAPASEIMHFPSEVVDARVNRDGSRIATLSADGIIRVWDPAQPHRPSAEFFAGTSHLEIALSPTGSHLVVREQAAPLGRPKIDALWDTRDGKLIAEFKRSARSLLTHPVVFNADGTLWLSVNSEEMIVRDTASGHVVADFGRQPELVFTATFLDNDRLATGSRDGRLRFWNVLAARLIRDIHGHNGRVFSVTADRQGEFLISVGGDQTVRLWDAATAELISLFKHSSAAAKAWILPDRQTLATVDVLGAVRRWDLRTDSRPAEDWRSIAELLAGNAADPASESSPPQRLDPAAVWERLRSGYPREFTASADDERSWKQRPARTTGQPSQ